MDNDKYNCQPMDNDDQVNRATHLLHAGQCLERLGLLAKHVNKSLMTPMRKFFFSDVLLTILS